jgi:hypothetical protein
MKKIGAIALALGMFVGCGGGDTAKAKDLKDKMCACKDADCAKKVNEEAEKWGKEMEGKYKDPKDVPEELMKTMLEMAQCEAKAQGGGGGAATP